MSPDDDSATVPVRVFNKAIEAITKQNVIITQLAIGFKKKQRGKNQRNTTKTSRIIGKDPIN